MTLTNCDIEDFNNTGVRLRNTGFAKITGGGFVPPATGTYQAEVYVEYCDGLVIIENAAFYPGGATRAKQTPIYMENDSLIYVVGCNIPQQYQVGNTIYSLPYIGSSYAGYLQRAVSINNLDVAQFYNRYAGTAVLASGSATVAFTNPQWDANYHVLVTGNVTETFAVTNKTMSGFVIQSSNVASSARVDWMAVRTGT